MKLSCKTHVIAFIFIISAFEIASKNVNDTFSFDKTGTLFAKDISDERQQINDIDYLLHKKINRLAAINFSQPDLTLDFTNKSAFCSKPNESCCIAREIINYSKQFIGARYRRGAKGPNVFDCSGFTSYVFKKFGIDLSGACVVQVNQGISVKKDELQTGDLIFFKGRNIKSSRIGHVGIVVSNNDGSIKFIHACNRGVTIDELDKSSYYRPRYVKGARVLTNNVQS